MADTNLPETITVDVCQSDINDGCVAKSDNCPVARAMNRVLPADCWAAVTEDEISVHKFPMFTGELVGWYRVPGHVADWINNFDKHGSPDRKPVEPLTFVAERGIGLCRMDDYEEEYEDEDENYYDDDDYDDEYDDDDEDEDEVEVMS